MKIYLNNRSGKTGFCQTGYFLFIWLAMARITPRAIPSTAANNTLNSSGSKKVMVCAGIQKKGIVRLKTKLH
jgi:hypothetical protein